MIKKHRSPITAERIVVKFFSSLSRLNVRLAWEDKGAYAMFFLCKYPRKHTKVTMQRFGKIVRKLSLIAERMDL